MSTIEEENRTRRQSALRCAPRVLKKNNEVVSASTTTGLHLDNDDDHDDVEKTVRNMIAAMSDAECRDAVCGFTEAIVKDMIDEDFGDELFNAYSDLFDLVHSSYTGEEVDYDNDDEREARKLHQQIQWIKHLEPGQVPDALVAEFIAIKEGVIRLEEMFTLHSDDHRDDVTRTLGEERRAIIKMGDALNAAIEELMVKLGKTYEDIIEDLRSGACQDCENRDECLGGGAA